MTAVDLICQRVASGLADERLADVAERIELCGAHHCVVFHEGDQSFVGLIRLADIAGRSDPGNRLLGDLVSRAMPCVVRPTETADAVAALFERHRLGEVVVLSPEGRYVGLVTGESVLDWSRREHRRAEMRLREEQAALRETQAQLQAASLAKDHFIAALSHELRTPLNPVLLIASENANRADLPEEIRRDFQTIAQNAALEARLVGDLLDHTRMSRGKMSLAFTLELLQPVLDAALEKIRPEMAVKEQHLEVVGTADGVRIRCDPVRLGQVFWYVLHNAVKFTPPGGRIRLAIQRGDSENEVKILVTDNGVGMTAAELARVFVPFGQTDGNETDETRPVGGLGLGMAIARRILELHESTIQAASAGRGEGATFTMTLPIANTTESTAPFAPADCAGSILLVEDHEPSRRALTRLLRRRNYQVSQANSVATALALAAEQKFCLVISDIGLPDGDGFELMAQLRQRFGLRGIALSGYGMEADLARSREAGFDFHLIKPVSMSALEVALTAMRTRDGTTAAERRSALRRTPGD